MKRSSNAGDISPVEAEGAFGQSSRAYAGKSLESGLNHGRQNEKTAEHLEKVEYHEDEAAASKPDKRVRLKRHCGRRWKWYLLATVIFLAIMLPVL